MRAGEPRLPLGHDPVAARERAGLSRQRLAALCGVSVAQIARIELGTRNAGPAMLAKLAGALGCAPDDLKAKRGAQAAAVGGDAAAEHRLLAALVARYPRVVARGMVAERGEVGLCPLVHDPDAVFDARKRAGLTQPQLARETGLSVSSVSEFERDICVVPAGRIGDLVRVLGCPRVGGGAR